MKNKLIVFEIIPLLIIVGLSGCIEDNIEDKLNDEEKKFIGMWYQTSNQIYTFKDNGTLYFEKSWDTSPTIYDFEVENSILRWIDRKSNKTYDYNYEFSNDILILSYVESDYNITLNRFNKEALIPLEIIYFELEPNEIFKGQKSSLKWYIKNATSYLLTDEMGNKIKSDSRLHYGVFAGDEDVSPTESKSYILYISNFNFEETITINLVVDEFLPNPTFDDSVGDVMHHKLVDNQWAYVPYQGTDKEYLDIVSMSHSFSGPVVTLTMTLADTVKESVWVIYHIYIENEGKTYQAYYSNGVGSWSIKWETGGGWLNNVKSGNTLTASFEIANPESYYEIWGETWEIAGSGSMQTSEWWGDYAPDSYDPWDS